MNDLGVKFPAAPALIRDESPSPLLQRLPGRKKPQRYKKHCGYVE